VTASLCSSFDDSEILVAILDTVATSSDWFKGDDYFSIVALFIFLCMLLEFLVTQTLLGWKF
jgi:hypothetical protein